MQHLISEPAVSNVKVLQKAFDILEIVSRADAGISLADITRMSGLNKSTVYRLLSTMVERLPTIIAEVIDAAKKFQDAWVSLTVNPHALILLSHFIQRQTPCFRLFQ